MGEPVDMELVKLRNALSLIESQALNFGTGWCIAQARAALLDLDYDGYPGTGRPETEPPSPEGAVIPK